MSSRRKAMFGFLAVYLVTGISYWMIPYGDMDMTGSDQPLLWVAEIFVISLLVPIFIDVPISLGGLYAGFGFPAAVITRIVIETYNNPTTHNLWPFELLIATVISLPIAFIAVALGTVIKKKLKPDDK